MAASTCDTYYAASVNDHTRYPVLRGDLATDICVVGGGFSGIATALTLAERGYQVILLEADRLGTGASGRNGGQLIGGMSGENTIRKQLGEAGTRLLCELHYRGHDIIEDRVKRYGIACDLKHGWMEAAARPKHFDAIHSHYDDLVANGAGRHLELIMPGDMASVLGTDAYHGGFIDRRSGHLHPLNLCLGEARAAAGRGVQIFEQSPAIELTGGTQPFVATPHGRVTAGSIVLAGNTAHRFGRGRLKGIQFPTGSYIVATAPLGKDVASALNPRDLAVCDSNTVLDYFRLSADGRLIFGGRCNYSNRDPKDIGGELRPRMVRIFPQVRHIPIEFAWGGRLGITINRAPAIGRLEPNLYYLQGYVGHGVNVTHIAAELVADAICGTLERFDLFNRLKHVQLPLGEWAGNQLLALGMLYFRLRDLI